MAPVAFDPLYDTSTMGNRTFYGTSTLGWPTSTADYFSINWPVAVEYAPPPLDRIHRDRQALAYVRSFWTEKVETVTPARASLIVFRVAPRRTVVPRGIVSWVRAGTRRPL